MGYEVKIYVVEGSMTIKGHADKAHSYVRVLGMVDVAKPGYDSEIYKLSSSKEEENPAVFLYDLNGNEEHTEDRYGKKLRLWPIETALAAIETDSGSDSFDRFKYALALLQSVSKHRDRNDHQRLGVVFYGY